MEPPDWWIGTSALDDASSAGVGVGRRGVALGAGAALLAAQARVEEDRRHARRLLAVIDDDAQVPPALLGQALDVVDGAVRPLLGRVGRLHRAPHPVERDAAPR